MARTLAQAMAKVVTFMPPAVEPGAPPMNISRIMVNSEAGARRVRSRELKPAVRQVADWKKAWDRRSHQGCPARAPLRSTTSRTVVPATNRMAEAVNTVRDCRPRRLPGPCLRPRSLATSQGPVWASTPKPRPPRMSSTDTVCTNSGRWDRPIRESA